MLSSSNIDISSILSNFFNSQQNNNDANNSNNNNLGNIVSMLSNMLGQNYNTQSASFKELNYDEIYASISDDK